MNILENTIMNMIGYICIVGSITAVGWFVAFWLLSTLLYGISWLNAKKGKLLDISGDFMIGYLACIVLVLSPVIGIVGKSIGYALFSLIIGLVLLYYTQNLWIINVIKNEEK